MVSWSNCRILKVSWRLWSANKNPSTWRPAPWKRSFAELWAEVLTVSIQLFFNCKYRLKRVVLVFRFWFGRNRRTTTCPMVYVGQQEKRTSAKTNATEYIVSIKFYGLYAFIGIEHMLPNWCRNWFRKFGVVFWHTKCRQTACLICVQCENVSKICNSVKKLISFRQ